MSSSSPSGLERSGECSPGRRPGRRHRRKGAVTGELVWTVGLNSADNGVAAHDGVWLVDGIELIAQGVQNKSWVDGTLGAVGAGLDVPTLVSDPVGALAVRWAAGVWMFPRASGRGRLGRASWRRIRRSA